jgi:hypothetical protein
MQRCLPLLALAATLIGSGAAAASQTSDEMLAAETAGRVAGPPVSCILQRSIKTVHIIPGTALVYETNNGTRYVNYPSGAGFLRRDQILVTDTHSSQLCDVDIVRLVDSLSRSSFGSVGLGKFIPYAKPRK